LIRGIPQSRFREAEIEKLVEGMLERRTRFGKPTEYVAGRATLWMPYYRIRMEYWRLGEEPKGRAGEGVLAETALNAMFCGRVGGERELLMIFRPNYLRHELTSIVPADGEVVGSVSGVDLEGVLSGLVNRLNGVQGELAGLRSTLSRNYVRKRRYSMLLPTGSLREEKELSEKIAKLDALKNTIRLCLNIFEEVGAIAVLDSDTFYYPTSVFLLKKREDESQRFLIVNLVKGGGMQRRPNCDVLLTQLCSRNEGCGKLVAAAVAGSPLWG